MDQKDHKLMSGKGRAAELGPSIYRSSERGKERAGVVAPIRESTNNRRSVRRYSFHEQKSQ